MKMFDFPEVIRLPVRDGVDAIMSWLLTNLDGLFDAIGLVILNVMLAFEAVFIFIPWFVMIPLVFFAGWKMMKSIRAGIVMALMLFPHRCLRLLGNGDADIESCIGICGILPGHRHTPGHLHGSE
jgi:ABC-type proline/glycine betaine transport system permease subunit